MIEIVIAALIQIATITADASITTQDAANAIPPTTETPAPGGTGSWDDNG